jgi:hypothetical protein
MLRKTLGTTVIGAQPDVHVGERHHRPLNHL